MKRCPNCNAEYDEGKYFCASCGTRLAADNEETDYKTVGGYQEPQEKGLIAVAKNTLTVNYCNFSGRASRSEYWYWMLATFLIGAIYAFVISMVLSAGSVETAQSILGLALLSPNLCINARRLHDLGRSAWWLLLGFIPLINLYYLYLMVKNSEQYDNQYGPYPPRYY